MKTKNVNEQKTISIQLLLFLLIVITFYPTAEANAQRISSACTSNNSLDVKVLGIHGTGSQTIPGLSSKVKKVIVECTCRGMLRYETDNTCPNSITFTVNGQNISAPRTKLDEYSTWWGLKLGQYEGYFFVYRLEVNTTVTSITYNAPTSTSDRLGMKGLTAWIVNDDVANANQPQSIFIDEFHYQYPDAERKIRCFNVPIKPTKAAKDMTIHLPVSEIDDPTEKTRYSATALNASGNVVATFPAQWFSDSKVIPEIRLDKMQLKNVPSNATTIKVCIESPNPDVTGFHGPSFMIGSVAVTSKQAKPTLTCPPGGIVTCASDIQPGVANYTPSCPDDNRTVVVTPPGVSIQTNCPGETYTYTHSVGGLSCKQVFTIGNSDAPSIACNANIQYVCEEDIDPAFPDYTASCGTSAIEKSEPVVVGEPGCAGTSYTYTFSVSDACGRSTSCEQVFVIKEDCTTEVETNYCDFVANEAPIEDCVYTLKNDNVTIYDCNTCTNYENPENCKPVTGLENLSANEAFWAANKTVEYFKNIHNVVMPPINIFVNCSENPNDAVYKIKHNAILLGKGDDIERTSMAAIDIIAHELTHHLIKSIGSLSNYGENGALNESFADIFGEMVENYVKGSNDWIFGSEVFFVNSEYNGIRNLSDPDDPKIEVSQPDYYGGRYWFCETDEDNGCPHIRSGVQNLWFYLLVNGNENFEGIGKEKASKIAFENMISLKPTNTYDNAMSNSIRVANNLYPNDTKIATAVEEAWAAVGIYISTIPFTPITLQFTPITAETNYSETVSLILDNNQTIIKNKYTTIYDYSTCSNYSQNCNPVVGIGNFAANEVLWATTKAYEYFSNTHSFSLTPIISFVNNDYPANAAFYNYEKSEIYYGAGDGIERNSMTSPDIVGHELAHHLINNIFKNKNIEIKDIDREFGALFESFGDIFGEILEYHIDGDNDWIIGSKVVEKDFAGLRSLKNPNDNKMIYRQPDTYNGMYWLPTNIDSCYLSCDFGGIHTNSGVQNYWFYLLANGGIGVNDHGIVYKVDSIGIEKAAKIVFKYMKDYLTPGFTYSDAAISSINAAEVLYGYNSFEAKQTKAAWHAVVVPFENSTTWRIGEIIETRDATFFELMFDSLKQDISADNLQIILSPKINKKKLTISKLHPNLSFAEVDTSYSGNSLKIMIHRKCCASSNKKLHSISKIPHGEPLAVLCLPVENVGSDPFAVALAPIDISGGTFVNGNLENFKQSTLHFSFAANMVLGTDPLNYWLPLSLSSSDQTCKVLGSIEINIFGDSNPYNYVLKNVNNDTLFNNSKVNNNNIKIFGLNKGIYELYIADVNGKNLSINIPINFLASANGNHCCPNEISIPNGSNKGIFQAIKTLDINGYVERHNTAEFIICDQ